MLSAMIGAISLADQCTLGTTPSPITIPLTLLSFVSCHFSSCSILAVFTIIQTHLLTHILRSLVLYAAFAVLPVIRVKQQ